MRGLVGYWGRMELTAVMGRGGSESVRGWVGTSRLKSHPRAHLYCWRRGAVVSGVRRMNEVNARRARLVPGWMGDRLRAGIPSWYVTSQLGQISLASLRGRVIEYQLRLG